MKKLIADNEIFFVDETSLLFPERLAPSTWLEHIPFCFWLTSQLEPKVFVELGSYYGSSYFSVCQAAEQYGLSTRCFAIDTWAGDEQSGYYQNDVYESVFAYNQKKYSSFSTLMRSTFEEARASFQDGSIDFLHVDGFHTYEQVKEDFETWLPKLSANAVIMFHDINVRERDFGVYRFWDELKKEYKHFEFLHGYGLGVIALGNTYPVSVSKLFDPLLPAPITDLIKKYFSRLGSGVNYCFLYGKHNNPNTVY
ncbi:MAG TPA: class I SAM-dependent methyltransferase [Puia sp.]